jgi:hypothetical protein
MRSFFRKKLWIILLAALALGALTVLAIGLDQIPFREAQQFSQKEATDVQGISAREVVDAWMSVPIWKQVVLWVLLGMLVILLAMLMSPEMRKRLILLFIRTTLTLIGVYYLLKNYGADFFTALNIQGVALTEQAKAVNSVPAPVFEPPQASSAVSYVISFIFALLWVLLLWRLYHAWKKYSDVNRSPLEEIAKIARSSLRDLSDGRDSSDVIIKCYLRMGDIVADKRQLHREAAMTPQEFALRLERAGLPGDAVQRLTRLFEAVRYGDRKSSPREVNEAVGCLNTILHYCGETA